MLMQTWSYYEDAGVSNGLLNNLISCWQQDSDATDEQGTNDGTATSVTRDTGDYKVGTASGNYNGSSSRILVSDSASLDITGDMSWSFWMNADTAPSSGTKNMMIVAKTGGAPNDSFYINWRYIDASNNAMRLLISDNGTSAEVLDVNVVINTGTRYHIVVERDASASTMELFKDNVSQGTATGSKTSIHSGTSDLYIGSISASSLFYDGGLDQVAVWDTLLGTDKRAALLNTGSGLPYSSFTS